MENLSKVKGMSHICLSVNMVNETNLLTQEMLPVDNTIYSIKYDFDLNGATIKIPSNSILKFEGGSFNNGTIILTKTAIDSPSYYIFKEKLVIQGECRNINTPVSWFGAIGDGLSDDSEALQRTINFAAPFYWKNNISETKKSMGQAFTKVIGNGTYRITKSILLNPFVTIEGIKNCGFYENIDGFSIIADFSNKDGFIFDAAPYNSTGERVLGLVSSRTDWDNGKYTGCPGWTLQNLNILVAAGKNIKGIVNRTMSMQSHILHCSLKGANIGILTSTTWGGSIRNNNIRARAIGIANINDVTTDEQNNNYITIGGNQPSTEEFDYPNMAWLNLENPTCNLYNIFSHVNHYNNTWEGATVGSITSGRRAQNLANNYIEGGTYQYCYTFNTCDFTIKPGTTLCSNASLLFVTGSPSNTSMIDLSSADLFLVKDFGKISWVNKVDLLGSYVARKLPYHPQINLLDADLNGKLTIYMSQQGTDNNSGYTKEYPVRTLQEAIIRCMPDKHNIIIKQDTASDNDTKYHYNDGTHVTNKTISLDHIEISGGGSIQIGHSYNERHSLPKGIRSIYFNNISFTMNDLAGDYQPLVPVVGNTSLFLNNCNITGGVLIGCKWADSGIATISAIKSNLACKLVASGGTEGAFSWIDTARGTTTTGGSVGDVRCKKISSTLYPNI